MCYIIEISHSTVSTLRVDKLLTAKITLQTLMILAYVDIGIRILLSACIFRCFVIFVVLCPKDLFIQYAKAVLYLW